MNQILYYGRPLKIIEDSCECMGVRFKYPWGKECGEASPADRKALTASVGSLGDIGCFSTYSCHLIATGVGGIATTNSPELAKLMRSYMNHGRRSENIVERFTFDRIGYSCRPTEFEAAIGLGQLHRLPKMIAARRRNAEFIAGHLLRVSDMLDFINPIEINREYAWMMFPIVLKHVDMDRDEFCTELHKEGIDTRPLFPLLNSPVYRRMYPGLEDKFPRARYVSEHGFYVGCHQDLTQEDLEHLASGLLRTTSKLSRRIAVAAA